MNFVHAEYNKFHNCIDVTHYEGYILRFDCNMIEENLKLTPSSQCAVNALAIDEPLQYVTIHGLIARTTPPYKIRKLETIVIMIKYPSRV